MESHIRSQIHHGALSKVTTLQNVFSKLFDGHLIEIIGAELIQPLDEPSENPPQKVWFETFRGGSKSLVRVTTNHFNVNHPGKCALGTRDSKFDSNYWGGIDISLVTAPGKSSTESWFETFRGGSNSLVESPRITSQRNQPSKCLPNARRVNIESPQIIRAVC